MGSYELLEALKENKPDHLLLASTSSVYGSNTSFPYSENIKADTQMSVYAATKKSMEVMAHSYSNIYGIPITIFRFFTVYGPWGRPDMALFKFTKAIIEDKEIEVFNYGDMERDFTYVEDLTEAVFQLIEKVPRAGIFECQIDSLSNVAPYRVVNIGNSKPEKLENFISALERILEKSKKKV